MQIECEASTSNICCMEQASHSFSWYWRVWFHTWFAGAAKVTAEGQGLSVFACNESTGNVLSTFDGLTRLGEQARAVLHAARTHERGTPLMPLGARPTPWWTSP